MFSEIEEEGVLFDVQTNEYLNLNPTFCSIFKYLRANLGLLEIREKLLKEYDVPVEVCESELMESIEILVQRGLIREKAVS